MRIEVISDTALRQMEPARLMALIAHVQRFIDKAVAYQRRLIAVAEAQRAARAVGDACVADSLVRSTGMSRGAARRAARQAKVIAGQPEVADALAGGDINTDQAEAIARADVGDETRRGLVAAAASEGTDATRDRAAAAEIAARHETPEQRFMRQHANRFLRFYNSRDGMVCLEGALDPDNGARLKAKVSAIANRMWRTDKRQPPSQRRSPEQRDIDALCAATSQRPRPGPSRAHVRTGRPPEPDPSRAHTHTGRPPEPGPSRAHVHTDSRRHQRPDIPVISERGADAQCESPDSGLAEGRRHQRRDLPVISERGGDAQCESPDSGLAEAGLTAGTGAADPHPPAAATRAAGISGPTTAEAGDCAAGDRLSGAEAGDCAAGGQLTGDSDNRIAEGNGAAGDCWCGDGEWGDFDDDGKRVVPVLRVSTSLDALRGGLHRAGIADSGETLSAATVRRMACDAEIIPTVLNGKGRVIDVGRRTRRISEAMRCALIARDGGCVWPGCDASPSRCDAHHVKHWADGGPTNADNLALLCHRHHILLHEGRHRLQCVGDAWMVLKPDGKPLHVAPASAGSDRDSSLAGAGSATAFGAPDRDVAWALDAPPVPSFTAGQRSTAVAPESHPSQLTLACHGRGETTIRLKAGDVRSRRAGDINPLDSSDRRRSAEARAALRGSTTSPGSARAHACFSTRRGENSRPQSLPPPLPQPRSAYAAPAVAAVSRERIAVQPTAMRGAGCRAPPTANPTRRGENSRPQPLPRSVYAAPAVAAVSRRVAVQPTAMRGAGCWVPPVAAVGRGCGCGAVQPTAMRGASRGDADGQPSPPSLARRDVAAAWHCVGYVSRPRLAGKVT